MGAVVIVITAALNVRDALLQLSDGKTPSADPTFDTNLKVSLGLSIAQLTSAILMIACFSLVIDAPWKKQKPKFLILWLVGNALSLIGSILIVYLLVAQGSYGALTSTAVLSLQVANVLFFGYSTNYT